jgi:hypothetical protein
MDRLITQVKEIRDESIPEIIIIFPEQESQSEDLSIS